ncbi:MAG: UDP-2,3-diacylglucosamine diphosphatase, partial [Rhodobacterales bacterium]
FDGVICGHIHAACIRKIDELDYINTGDWVESCTAVVESADGSLHLIDWAAEMRRRETPQGRLARRSQNRQKQKEVA